MTAQHLVVSFHVFLAIVVIGPLVFATSATPRAIRSGDARTLRFLVTTTRVYAVVSLIVPVLGAGAVHRKYGFAFSQTWVWLSLVLYVVALGLVTGLVGGAQRRALTALEAGEQPAPRHLATINAGAGLAAATFGVIAFLMVFKPGLG